MTSMSALRQAAQAFVDACRVVFPEDTERCLRKELEEDGWPDLANAFAAVQSALMEDAAHRLDDQRFLDRLARVFPGLVDSEADVNGADVVAWLTKAIQQSKAGVVEIAEESWRAGDKECPIVLTPEEEAYYRSTRDARCVHCLDQWDTAGEDIDVGGGRIHITTNFHCAYCLGADNDGCRNCWSEMDLPDPEDFDEEQIQRIRTSLEEKDVIL